MLAQGHIAERETERQRGGGGREGGRERREENSEQELAWEIKL